MSPCIYRCGIKLPHTFCSQQILIAVYKKFLKKRFRASKDAGGFCGSMESDDPWWHELMYYVTMLCLLLVLWHLWSMGSERPCWSWLKSTAWWYFCWSGQVKSLIFVVFGGVFGCLWLGKKLGMSCKHLSTEKNLKLGFGVYIYIILLIYYQQHHQPIM